jgi:hypothetical protein
LDFDTNYLLSEPGAGLDSATIVSGRKSRAEFLLKVQTVEGWKLLLNMIVHFEDIRLAYLPYILKVTIEQLESEKEVDIVKAFDTIRLLEELSFTKEVIGKVISLMDRVTASSSHKLRNQMRELISMIHRKSFRIIERDGGWDIVTADSLAHCAKKLTEQGIYRGVY